MRKWLIVCLIALLLISPVAATDTITIDVGAKHIVGTSEYPMYLISTTNGNGYYKMITSDYIVSCSDYYKVHLGDIVQLQLPDNNGVCKVIQIKLNKNSW